MKKLLYLVLIIFSGIFMISCDSSIQGNKETKITEKEIKLNPANQIIAKGNYRLICLQDNKDPRMVIETYQNLIENVKIDNSQQKLSISEGKTVSNTDLYNIYIYNIDFENFKIYDSINVEVNTPLRINQMKVSLSNASKFLINNLTVNEMDIEATDNAKVSLQGSATKLTVKAGKSSDISAPFFSAANTHIMLSDVAVAEINTKDKITGQISGNSNLTIIGNPAKDIKQKDLAQIKYKQ